MKGHGEKVAVASGAPISVLAHLYAPRVPVVGLPGGLAADAHDAVVAREVGVVAALVTPVDPVVVRGAEVEADLQEVDREEGRRLLGVVAAAQGIPEPVRAQQRTGVLPRVVGLGMVVVGLRRFYRQSLGDHVQAFVSARLAPQPCHAQLGADATLLGLGHYWSVARVVVIVTDVS